ncbi:MAG: elongation factor G [Pseudodesulfovibrio sp.]|uniref:Elongation factor G n=1 Tax=Pseudodesulfovibrio aespoeensis (strain ATCC 700646 / DSM 10631 / Aspo-2) TaxID=643562 RepID=E6VST7_PSEA9|nr:MULTISPECIES: elongation factor G [Pseudodesulfovibrio]MBU4378292.1 elongation factor G [Pseudomonadota bacterium]ADU63181.1 translation elongation factor G [Pseudodesulfovibrio aespoeensis Aspo-2]MBU4475978.1 elongation factor G [Pseudomonadota bacterium]MBU4516891.1 elongation factor G [Pseudomonadota bacterium]MBU4523209.1 elongation factor G [Pseudomonadota bacterium]
MPDLKTQRTYALVGHGGSGKTTVAEMLLFNAGVINRLGKVEDGTTVLDYEPEEIKRRGSTQPGFATFKWKKNDHFLIDTPGDSNFSGDLSYAMTAADGAVLVIDAVDGVKPQTRKVWSQIKGMGLPAMIVVNKMDRDRAEFDTAFAGISEALGARPALLYYPIGSKEEFRGVVDMMSGKALLFGADGAVSEAAVPDDIADEVEALREAMVENIAESDEELMEKYLEEGQLSQEEITKGLAAGVAAGELVPVVVASALNNQGGQMILDTIQNLLPDPLAHKPWVGEEGERVSSPDEPLACFVFKTLADPFAGQLTVVRVLSGELKSDSALLNASNGEKERVGQLLLMSGKEQSPSKTPMGPGSIATLAKLKNTSTGDTLVAEKGGFVLKRPDMAPQLITFALAPAEKGEEDKVYAAVAKLLDEDITLVLTRDGESGDILLSGMGQNHIEVSVDKAKRRYKTEILLKTPKVPYRETFKTGAREIQGRHKKQSGGRGQFGDCWIHVTPRGSGEGYEFADQVVGGSIPRQFIPAVDKGVQESAARGVLAGYPVIDFQVALYDGSFHSVDSSEMAFKVAGSLAFKKACEKAKMALLEPIMLVTVAVPDAFMGDVIGDLSSRRGKVLGSDSQAGITEVKAHVPMAEMLKYAPDLNSMTGGQGTFFMEFASYEECPPQEAEKVIAAHKKGAEDE